MTSFLLTSVILEFFFFNGFKYCESKFVSRGCNPACAQPAWGCESCRERTPLSNCFTPGSGGSLPFCNRFTTREQLDLTHNRVLCYGTCFGCSKIYLMGLSLVDTVFWSPSPLPSTATAAVNSLVVFLMLGDIG